MADKLPDRTFDGVKLTDDQLDAVIGGVDLSPQQAVDFAPRLNMIRPVGKPIAHK